MVGCRRQYPLLAVRAYVHHKLGPEAMSVGFALNQLATVYARDSVGVYNVVLRTLLPCRLIQLPRNTNSMEARAEAAKMRRFMWDPSYDLPGHVQIEDGDGGRWNPVESTDNAPWLFSSIHHRSIDVVKAA